MNAHRKKRMLNKKSSLQMFVSRQRDLSSEAQASKAKANDDHPLEKARAKAALRVEAKALLPNIDVFFQEKVGVTLFQARLWKDVEKNFCQQ